MLIDKTDTPVYEESEITNLFQGKTFYIGRTGDPELDDPDFVNYWYITNDHAIAQSTIGLYLEENEIK